MCYLFGHPLRRSEERSTMMPMNNTRGMRMTMPVVANMPAKGTNPRSMTMPTAKASPDVASRAAQVASQARAAQNDVAAKAAAARSGALAKSMGGMGSRFAKGGMVDGCCTKGKTKGKMY